MCRNSSNTHNVLNNTAKEQVSELKNANESITETEEEVSVPANINREGKANTETSKESHKPYSESFELNQETFVQEEQVFHDLESQKDSAKLLRWYQWLNHFSFKELKLLVKLDAQARVKWRC